LFDRFVRRDRKQSRCKLLDNVGWKLRGPRNSEEAHCIEFGEADFRRGGNSR
jgi:hypothetical protein